MSGGEVKALCPRAGNTHTGVVPRLELSDVQVYACTFMYTRSSDTQNLQEMRWPGRARSRLRSKPHKLTLKVLATPSKGGGRSSALLCPMYTRNLPQLAVILIL